MAACEPALVPANFRRLRINPASSRAQTAPPYAMPLTPPPSSTRATRLCGPSSEVPDPARWVVGPPADSSALAAATTRAQRKKRAEDSIITRAECRERRASNFPFAASRGLQSSRVGVVSLSAFGDERRTESSTRGTVGSCGGSDGQHAARGWAAAVMVVAALTVPPAAAVVGGRRAGGGSGGGSGAGPSMARTSRPARLDVRTTHPNAWTSTTEVGGGVAICQLVKDLVEGWHTRARAGRTQLCCCKISPAPKICQKIWLN